MVDARSGMDDGPLPPAGLGAELTEAGLVVVVDGDCELCSDLAAWVAVRATLPVRVEHASAGIDAVVVRLDGVRQEGAAGVALALSATGGWWARLGCLLRQPPAARLGAWAYRRFARHHHRLARVWVRLGLGRVVRRRTGA